MTDTIILPISFIVSYTAIQLEHGKGPTKTTSKITNQLTVLCNIGKYAGSTVVTGILSECLQVFLDKETAMDNLKTATFLLHALDGDSCYAWN